MGQSIPFAVGAGRSLRIPVIGESQMGEVMPSQRQPLAVAFCFAPTQSRRMCAVSRTRLSQSLESIGPRHE